MGKVRGCVRACVRACACRCAQARRVLPVPLRVVAHIAYMYSTVKQKRGWTITNVVKTEISVPFEMSLKPVDNSIIICNQ